MQDAAGFWSYTHADNDGDGGRIARLAKLIAAEYEMLTGEPLELFVDRDELGWGVLWRDRIDEALSGTTFFIPIVTPRFFQSEECRKELLRFAGAAKSLGLEELILPILYIDVPTLHDAAERDEAETIVASRQWEDWRELRLEAEDSAPYRKGVNRLATRLREIALHVAELPDRIADEVESKEPDEDGDVPLFELLAEAEDVFPEWTETMEGISEAIVDLGEAAKEWGPRFDEAVRKNASFKERLALLRKFSRAIDEPVGRIEQLGQRYAQQLIAIDPVIHRLYREALTDAELSAENREAAKSWARSTQELADTQDGTVDMMSGLLDSMRPLGNTSRDVRKQVRRTERGLKGIIDGKSVFDGWRAGLAELLALDEADEE
jgi:hypothetical protein